MQGKGFFLFGKSGALREEGAWNRWKEAKDGRRYKMPVNFRYVSSAKESVMPET